MSTWIRASGNAAYQSNDSEQRASTCDESAYRNKVPHDVFGHTSSITIEIESIIDITILVSDQELKGRQLIAKRGERTRYAVVVAELAELF